VDRPLLLDDPADLAAALTKRKRRRTTLSPKTPSEIRPQQRKSPASIRTT